MFHSKLVHQQAFICLQEEEPLSSPTAPPSAHGLLWMRHDRERSGRTERGIKEGIKSTSSTPKLWKVEVEAVLGEACSS